MEHPSDKKLLERYAIERSQSAFAALVERYVKLVYSTCYRELGQRELAEDATQAVFIALAANARSIQSPAALLSWLYATARHKARDIRKLEGRRMAWENRAAEDCRRRNEDHGHTWESIEPALNDALSGLCYADRQAILLRFFDEKSLSDVGLAMGTNEEAARKRVARALERLRAALVKRKAAAVSVGALAALLTQRAMLAVPAHLPASIAQSSDAIASLSSPPIMVAGGLRGGCALNPILAKGLLIMSTTKIAAASATVAVAMLLGLAFYASHRAHALSPPGTYIAGQPADAATTAAVQQIQTDGQQEVDAFYSDDPQEALALYLSMEGFRGGAAGYIQGLHTVSPMYRHSFPSGLQVVVTSCSTAGNSARARGDLIDKGSQKKVGTFDGLFSYSGGKWLIKNNLYKITNPGPPPH